MEIALQLQMTPMGLFLVPSPSKGRHCSMRSPFCVPRGHQ